MKRFLSTRALDRQWMATAAVLLALASSSLAGCGYSPTSPTSNAPYSQTDLVVGDGADAVAGSLVTLNYTGWLYDGSKTDHKGPSFDSSIGVQPFVFTLGISQVIEGFDKGIAGMRVGGSRRLVIPPSLAYGSTRSGAIPPNATLVFDIDLIAVQ